MLALGTTFSKKENSLNTIQFSAFKINYAVDHGAKRLDSHVEIRGLSMVPALLGSLSRNQVLSLSVVLLVTSLTLPLNVR
jgi:hypothetical protein